MLHISRLKPETVQIETMLSGNPCTTNDLDAVGTPDVNAQWAQVLSVGTFFYSDS